MLCTGRLPKNEKYCASLPQLSQYPLPAPLSNWSCTDLVSQNLNQPIPTLYPIDSNDRLGDCTVAGAAHHITLQAGLVGKQIVPNDSDVVSLYRQLGHGRDNGLELTQVLQAWMSGILGGNKILANCNVDPSNMNSVKQAIQYLGGVYIGFKTTSQSVALFQNHQPWTDAGREDGGGHCVVVTGFDDSTQMLDVLTWGNIQKATYGWWDKYVDECHAILTDDIAVFDSDTVANIQQAMPALA